MSMEQRNAVLQESLDQSWLWRTFAAMKHGFSEKPPRNVIGSRQLPVVIPLPDLISSHTSNTSTSTTTAATQEQKSSWLPKIAGAIALASGVGGIGALVNQYMQPDKQSEVVQPAETPPADLYGDLIKWLRDNGYNVPPVTP